MYAAVQRVVVRHDLECDTALLIRYLNRQVMVRQGRVEALLSTNPADFLDERFLPGALVGRV